MSITRVLALTALAGFAAAQTPPPALMACGTHEGNVEVLCGTQSPEDLEATPDGKFLITGEFVNGRGGAHGDGMMLFDLEKKTFSKIPIEDQPLKSWGDPACPGPPDAMLIPHGISLAKRGAKWQLDVVNHGGRQSMEMYELMRAGAGWKLIWHGCVVSKDEFNDVAALADGSFIATHPLALRKAGDNSNLFSGQPSGYVVKWTAATGEKELPNTRMGYPNGVVVSQDERWMYVNAWTQREVLKFDLKDGKAAGMVHLTFMPDNLTWTRDHRIVAAGVAGASGNCPAGSSTPCIQGFGVAEIDPAKMEARTLLDWQGKQSPISGVSVALKVGNAVYLGAFSGDRIVKVDLKK